MKHGSHFGMNPGVLRHYLDAFRCAKVCGGPWTIAVSTFPGGIAVGELGSEAVRRYASLEAALRGYALGRDAGRTLGDLLDDPSSTVEPPQPED